MDFKNCYPKTVNQTEDPPTTITIMSGNQSGEVEIGISYVKRRWLIEGGRQRSEKLNPRLTADKSSPPKMIRPAPQAIIIRVEA